MELIKNEEGSILPLAALILGVIILFSAVIIDGMNLIYYREKLSNAASHSFTMVEAATDIEKTELASELIIDMEIAHELFADELNSQLTDAVVDSLTYERRNGNVYGNFFVSYDTQLFLLDKFGLGIERIVLEKEFYITP